MNVMFERSEEVHPRMHGSPFQHGRCSLRGNITTSGALEPVFCLFRCRPKRVDLLGDLLTVATRYGVVWRGLSRPSHWCVTMLCVSLHAVGAVRRKGRQLRMSSVL